MTGMRAWRSLATRGFGLARAAGDAQRQGLVPTAQVMGRLLLGAVSAVLVILSAPVVVRGAPLADDFHNCLAPQDRGLLGFMSESFERLGLIRPARFAEILVTTGVCQNLPFGVAIALSLSLTFVVALLLRRLVAMLGSPAPWPDVAAAVWLLQPLGMEVALWPAALHVPLGLAAALGSLVAHRRGRVIVGALLGLAAMLSVEQTILALPLAAWLVAPSGRRRSVAVTMTAVAATVAVAYVLVPGNDPRLAAGASARVHGLFSDVAFFVRYPAVGVGAESIPLAVRWAFPVSVIVLIGGVLAGWWWAKGNWSAASPHVRFWRLGPLVAVVLLVVLVNAPVALSQPRQGSPRVFAPTWLLLATLIGLWLGRGRRGQPRALGAVAGLYLSGAVLSLALSSWVRVETAGVVQRISNEIAVRTTDGDFVTLCDVPRAAVSPAPRGAFAVHDYLYDWAAADALRYYTGRRATFRVHQADSLAVCPAGDSSMVVSFAELADRDG
jgi:hypothetical protein